jgi:hypothetical protein
MREQGLAYFRYFATEKAWRHAVKPIDHAPWTR